MFLGFLHTSTGFPFRQAREFSAECDKITGREIRVQPGVIAKIPQPQMSQMHLDKMNWKQ